MSSGYRLQGLVAADVRAAARLHRTAFPGFFLSSLGEAFLAEFYRCFLEDPSAVALVARDETGKLAGVVVGSTQPAGFFARLLRRRWLGFAAASVRAVLRHPTSAPRLIRAVSYRGDAGPEADGALLSSICVDPGRRGQGVGGLLLDGWCEAAAARRAEIAFLTTDEAGNDAVHAFYQSHGWTVAGRFTTPQDRPMRRYRRELREVPC